MTTESSPVNPRSPSPPRSRDLTTKPMPPSRKRLLAGSNRSPASTAGAASASDSAVSSDSSPDRLRKKTRDLPNFSDCHACGLHVNVTNPKHRLQTLDSLWRIVLLCRSCVKRLESSQLCSYCLSEVGDKGCYRCCECGRCVHRECVSSCFGSEIGFSVCVDCWVPELLANSNKVYKRRRDKKSACRKSVENAASVGEIAAEKKAAVAGKAKENALRGAIMARRAVELATGAIELVDKKNERSVSSGNNACDAADTAVIDVSELVFRLHRAMNGSPRLSRNLALDNLTHLAVPRVPESSDNVSARSLGSGGCFNTSASGTIGVCQNSKSCKNTNATASGALVYVRRSKNRSSILGSPKQVRFVYSRRRIKVRRLYSRRHRKVRLMYSRRHRKEKECVEKGGSIVGNCKPNDNNCLAYESRPCQKQVELEFDLDQDDTRNHSGLVSHGKAIILHDGRCSEEMDPYMLKYSRRHIGFKAIPNSEAKILHEGSYAESKAKVVRLPNCLMDV